MVKALSGIDFGALDDSISNLEKRLSMRIDSDYSWDWFAADNNSMLVSRFTRVFIEDLLLQVRLVWLEIWSPRVQPVC